MVNLFCMLLLLAATYRQAYVGCTVFSLTKSKRSLAFRFIFVSEKHSIYAGVLFLQVCEGHYIDFMTVEKPFITASITLHLKDPTIKNAKL